MSTSTILRGRCTTGRLADAPLDRHPPANSSAATQDGTVRNAQIDSGQHTPSESMPLYIQNLDIIRALDQIADR